MLKAIELYGFKSFADRTRLEFGEGISAVVGPNGSGKSNIVDAIKWVLGEQSVKKLRGNDMTDVIFSGSASREPVGAAEVTLSFDNGQKIFPLDVPEIHITRRIYRSGEGEYLINRQPSRLKDIKDLLGGTGLGTQAYSIIEQGRVEMLLQSSSVQRRGIFEEAAGISRFNAKKQEVQRRLERVDQNLIRLSDIVGEIENQLKNVKSQAGKAQLYRQYTARLQELRIQASLVDWRKSIAQSRVLHEEIETLGGAEKEAGESTERLEKTVFEQNAQLEEINRQIGRIEGEIVAVRERINGEESTIELQSAQVQQIEAETIQQGRQLIDLNVRSVDTEEMMRKTDEEIRRARDYHEEIGNSYQQLLETAEQLGLECEANQVETTRFRKELEEKRRQISRISGELGGLESHRQTFLENQEQSAARLGLCERQHAELSAKCEELKGICLDLEDSASYKQELLDTAKRQKSERLETLNRHSQELAGLKERLSGMSERISVLEELLRKHEGLSPGVKEVMRQAREPDSPFRFVFGLVADLFRVDVEAAPLIELALGPSAQYIVVSPEPELFRHIERTSNQFAGRVGFVWLDPNATEIPWVKGAGFDGRAHVLGRADRFVQTDPALTHLAQRLLGRTWIVENIAVAKSLYRESDDRTNFLTVRGEYLAADGTIIVGPSVGSSGVITRRSELRTLFEQIQLIETQAREKEITITVLKNRLSEDEKQLEEATKEYQRAVSEKESRRVALGAAEERLAQNSAQLQQLQDEADSLQRQLEKATLQWEETRRVQSELETGVLGIEDELARHLAESDERERARKEHQRKTTNVKIELAKSEERLDFLKDRIQQFEDRQQERQHLLSDHEKRVRTLDARRDQTLLAVLRLESSLALLYVRKETHSSAAKSLHQNRAELLEQRNLGQGDLKKNQQELHRIRSKAHAKQLELERLLQEQKVLSDRMQEDYGIELEELEDEQQPGAGPKSEDGNETTDDGEQTADDRNAVASRSRSESLSSGSSGPGSSSGISPTEEIEDLRQKIQRLGGVNLDAIETLEELETRYTTLSNQYQDLMNAKKSIEKIIEKINVDSQRLFAETFEGVKTHFLMLFQQLFGGGYADLVLEDENNILECGVDIVARPPGKDLKSVSLLSGGEKTLTCVALLLAFFRYRPNPVCILDEVDAALDEGNIDRFARVIREFRDSTQFLIVTHSKKTMASASTMYGITMQESGVSKPISVRFVDVGENGEILDTAGTAPPNEPDDEGPTTFSIDTDSRNNIAA